MRKCCMIREFKKKMVSPYPMLAVYKMSQQEIVKILISSHIFNNICISTVKAHVITSIPYICSFK